MDKFDVLVVYSSRRAVSASSTIKNEGGPFFRAGRSDDLGHAYAYFLEVCRQMKLKAALTTSADIIGPGRCRSYWRHKFGTWFKVNQLGQARIIFDKFAPFNKQQRQLRELMFSSRRIKPFNDPKLYQLFFDKLLTYRWLTGSTIPTVKISPTSIKQLTRLVADHRHQADFTEGFVLKDRFGSAGNHVYKIGRQSLKQIDFQIKAHPKIKFILQPLLKFNQEIRLIFMGDKVVQTYIRIAPKTGFCCNDHQGGQSVYIKKSAVPDRVLDLAQRLTGKLPKLSSLYALDFVVSQNGNPFLLEGNTGPGLNWATDNKIHQVKSQQLISMIVTELAKRVEKN